MLTTLLFALRLIIGIAFPYTFIVVVMLAWRISSCCTLSGAPVEEFEQEIKNNPHHVFARLQIAASLYKVNSAAGLPFAEQAVKLDPRVPLGHYLLGLLLLDTDQYLKAIPELEAAQRALPREAKLYLALSSAYARAGRRQEAERARATFMRLNQESEARPKSSAHE